MATLSLLTALGCGEPPTEEVTWSGEQGVSIAQRRITIEAVDLSTWATIPGIWTTATPTNGGTTQVYQAGFTAKTFTVTEGEPTTFTVDPAPGRYRFVKWWGTHSTSPTRVFTPIEDEKLIAYYCSDGTTTCGRSRLTLQAVARDKGGTVILPGLHITLQGPNDPSPQGLFTPAEPMVLARGTYTVVAHDYGKYLFHSWDDGSQNPVRTVVPGHERTLTASYCSNGTRTCAASWNVGRTGIIWGAYLAPNNPAWSRVMSTCSDPANWNVPIIVAINPNSGVGTSRDPAWASLISLLRNANCSVAAYVATKYGGRSQWWDPPSSDLPFGGIRTELDRWFSWYGTTSTTKGINAVFFDEMSNDSAGRHASYYSSIANYAKSKGAWITIGNPGNDTSAPYARSEMDVILVYENRGLPSWERLETQLRADTGRHKFGIIPYEVPSLPGRQWIQRAKASAQYIYLTDDAGTWKDHTPNVCKPTCSWDFKDLETGEYDPNCWCFADAWNRISSYLPDLAAALR